MPAQRVLPIRHVRLLGAFPHSVMEFDTVRLNCRYAHCTEAATQIVVQVGNVQHYAWFKTADAVRTGVDIDPTNAHYEAWFSFEVAQEPEARGYLRLTGMVVEDEEYGTPKYYLPLFDTSAGAAMS